MAEIPVLTARLSPEVKAAMRKQDPSAVVPDTCTVNETIYTGEEGGITCKLDFGHEDDKIIFFVSITNLIFDRRCPLYRQITAYQKHRIKKLKKQSGYRY